MAKNKKTVEGVAPNPGDAIPAPPMPVLSPAMTTDECMRALIQTVTILAGQQAKLTSDLAGVIGDREEARRKEQAEIDNTNRIRKECELTAQQRTQRAADRLWPVGDDRYHVSLLYPKKVVNEKTGKSRTVMASDSLAHPEVEINAGSQEEARGRYMKLCGIVGTEHQIRAALVSDRPAEAGDDEPAARSDEFLPAGVESM